MNPCTLCWSRAMNENYRTDLIVNTPYTPPRTYMTFKDMMLGPAFYPNIELLRGAVTLGPPKPQLCPECGRKVPT